MKKIFILIFICILINLNLFSINKINIVFENKEDYPDIVGNSDSIDTELPGVAVEILNILSKQLNLKITIERLPWVRALEVDLKNGKSDGLFLVSYQKKREIFGVYPMKNGQLDTSRSFKSVSYVFYKLKTSDIKWDGKTIKNLNGEIGVPLGYSIGDDLKKMGYKILESPSTLNDFKKLEAGRVKLIAALEGEGDIILKRNPELDKIIVKLSPPIITKDYYLILSHQFVGKNPELAEKIWNTLRDIKNVYYKKLYEKYIK